MLDVSLVSVFSMLRPEYGLHLLASIEENAIRAQNAVSAITR
jgi:hypothetical protein